MIKGEDSKLKPLAVTVPTALALTGIGRTKLYSLIASGKVKTVRVGGRTLVNYSSLESLASEGDETTITEVKRANLGITPKAAQTPADDEKLERLIRRIVAEELARFMRDLG